MSEAKAPVEYELKMPIEKAEIFLSSYLTNLKENGATCYLSDAISTLLYAYHAERAIRKMQNKELKAAIEKIDKLQTYKIGHDNPKMVELPDVHELLDRLVVKDAD